VGKADKRLVVVQVAALGRELVEANGFTEWQGLTFEPLEPVFPALTCTAQASFRTGGLPSEHGIVGNGFFFGDLMRPLFWEQSTRLITGPRIWNSFSSKGGRTTMLFWQQSLGESVDAILSPAPIHRHHGGIVQSCYSKPRDLYGKVRGAVGRDFNLMHYWGPMASVKSSDWIADATVAVLEDPAGAPDLCLTYLPGLDYDLQRYGPDSPKARAALETVFDELSRILSAAKDSGHEVLVFGDYAIGRCDKGAVLPNLALREAGLFAVREIGGAAYPDFYLSDAFAIVDHEIAHVHVNDPHAKERAIELLGGMDGVEKVLADDEQKELGIAHERSGDLVAMASDGHWFAYPWWEDKNEAPDYARHVDIHNKPGYDPCELFFGWPPGTVSRNTTKIKGSHGRIGPGREVCWAATRPIGGEPGSLPGLAGAARDWLEGRDGN